MEERGEKKSGMWLNEIKNGTEEIEEVDQKKERKERRKDQRK